VQTTGGIGIVLTDGFPVRCTPARIVVVFHIVMNSTQVILEVRSIVADPIPIYVRLHLILAYICCALIPRVFGAFIDGSIVLVATVGFGIAIVWRWRPRCVALVHQIQGVRNAVGGSP
jgi:hypothetical protein